jgi:hypothetical protein
MVLSLSLALGISLVGRFVSFISGSYSEITNRQEIENAIKPLVAVKKKELLLSVIVARSRYINSTYEMTRGFRTFSVQSQSSCQIVGRDEQTGTSRNRGFRSDSRK